MKVFSWIAWVSAIIGTISILLGVISGMFLPRPYFGVVTNATTFFLASNSFFLLTIALFIYIYRCRCDKD